MVPYPRFEFDPATVSRHLEEVRRIAAEEGRDPASIDPSCGSAPKAESRSGRRRHPPHTVQTDVAHDFVDFTSLDDRGYGQALGLARKTLELTR
jgi:hypothetical protein